MNIARKIPTDMDELREEYQSKVPMEGTCGPTLVAFLLGISVREVIMNWSQPYRGYCSFHELEKEINKYGFETERVHADNKDSFVLPEGVDMAIARIQWRGKYSHWTIAEKNTHFVYLERMVGQVHIFDNTQGWFEPEWNVAKDYMQKGYITSFVALKGDQYASN